MHPVTTYLQELKNIHDSSAGTGELTNYTPLFNLLNTVGKELKPATREEISRTPWIL